MKLESARVEPAKPRASCSQRVSPVHCKEVSGYTRTHRPKKDGQAVVSQPYMSLRRRHAGLKHQSKGMVPGMGGAPYSLPKGLFFSAGRDKEPSLVLCSLLRQPVRSRENARERISGRSL